MRSVGGAPGHLPKNTDCLQAVREALLGSLLGHDFEDREIGERHHGMPLALSRPAQDTVDMLHDTHHPRLRIRIIFGETEMIGPGKAELLERIDRTGSIAAAGREMSMSYKRAWQLISTLNAMFREPLVDSTRGGAGGGGAVLTDTGRTVLDLYRAFEADAAEAGLRRLGALQSLLRDIPEQK